MPPKRTQSPQKPAPILERTPLLEWVTATLGLVAAIGAIGFLTWEGLQADAGAPALAVAARSVTDTPQGYVLEVEVRNESRATAASVEVEGRLPAREGAEAEHVSLTFDYVPGRGRREGSMRFRRDPRGQPLALQVMGAVSP